MRGLIKWLSHQCEPMRAAGAALGRLVTSANGGGRDGWRDGAADSRAVDLPIRSQSMSARFRRLCAVFADGRCLIAEGYEPDDRLRLELVALREAGAIPPVLSEESVPLEEIAALRRAAGTGGAAVDGGGSARLLRSLLADAARAKASDVVFEQGRDACKVFAIVNDRKLPLCAALTPEEGRRVMGFLFHCKDEGSSQTSYRRASFQGFSIRAGGAVPLPGGISALRCERGPHDPDADHLFARLFYTDRLDEDMTLERLGFSAEEAALFAEIRMAMQGGVFIGGRAGDGKSTTLAVNLALQMAEMAGALNLVTLEDPVEYRIPGAIQIAVPTAGAGETRAGHFSQALMHFCRVHPASGMVSEIRDGTCIGIVTIARRIVSRPGRPVPGSLPMARNRPVIHTIFLVFLTISPWRFWKSAVRVRPFFTVAAASGRRDRRGVSCRSSREGCRARPAPCSPPVRLRRLERLRRRRPPASSRSPKSKRYEFTPKPHTLWRTRQCRISESRQSLPAAARAWAPPPPGNSCKTAGASPFSDPPGPISKPCWRTSGKPIAPLPCRAMSATAAMSGS